MPTVVDSLVVTLGLDASKFKAGQTDTRAELKRTSEAATQTAKDMEARGAQAAQFFSQVKTEALGLIGVLLGATGLADFATKTTNNLAALGRSARDIGETTQRVSAFTQIIEANGGTAESAAASLQGYANAIQRFKEFGDPSGKFISFLNVMGIGLNDRPIDAFMKFQKYVEENFNQPGGIQKIIQGGLGLGYDMGTINAAIQIRTLTEAVKEFGDALKRAPTPEDIQNLTALQKVFIQLEQTATKLGNTLMSTLAPALTDVVSEFTKLLTGGYDTSKPIGGLIGEFLVYVDLVKVAYAELQKLLPNLPDLTPKTYVPPSTRGEDQNISPEEAARRRAAQPQTNWWDRLKSWWSGGGINDSAEQRRLAGIRDKLASDLGISPEAAAGIVSNLYAESGVQGINERNPAPGTRGGFGWAQWTGQRRVDFEAYAAKHGLDPASDAANYGFLVEELKTKYPALLQQLRAGKITATEAANLFFQYESGGAPGLEGSRGGHIANAEKIANMSATRGSSFIPSAEAATLTPPPSTRFVPVGSATGGSSSSTSLHVGTIMVQTQATDSAAIARDIHKSLADELVMQGNRGLQ